MYDMQEKKILRIENRDEKRGKGELMCHSLFEEETSMQPVTSGEAKLCIYVSPSGLSH